MAKHQRVSKHYENDYLQNFLFQYMPLMTAKFVENSNYEATIYRIYLSKERPKTNLKRFQYEISISLKRLKKQLSIKANFRPFFQINSSNFR